MTADPPAQIGLGQNRASGSNLAVRSQASERLELCRFSDAGDDEAGHRLGDRRRKSAEARNRGGVGTVGAVGSMGI